MPVNEREKKQERLEWLKSKLQDGKKHRVQDLAKQMKEAGMYAATTYLGDIASSITNVFGPKMGACSSGGGWKRETIWLDGQEGNQEETNGKASDGGPSIDDAAGEGP